MAKTKYVCNSCGYESGKWYGRCPECGNWNTFEEVEVPDKKAVLRVSSSATLTPQKISTISTRAQERIQTGFEEFDRVLGGSEERAGIVPGSVILLSGDPGIGKSTLLLQLALNLANGRGQIADSKEKNHKPSAVHHVLYVSGEESETQVRMRAGRIAGEAALGKAEVLIASSTDIDRVVETINDLKPDLVILDSVQTMATTQLPGFPGSIPQIRYVTARLVAIAKTLGIPVFMVGHVTKEGIVAGPMVLSHMVDVVLYLEGEDLSGTRILRSFKNRFGDTSEVGIFVMEEKGLVEIQDTPSFFMNKQDKKSVPGSCVAVIMEGSRPLLVEIQALVVPSILSFPRRVATGISDRRLELLLAVIQKHVRLPIARMDVFLNVIGGLKIKETAADLATSLAVISSFKNKPLSATAAVGEVGLLGELKTVASIDKRIKEAKKFGFSNVLSIKHARFLTEAAKEML